MNDITALMATMKAAAEKATPGEWCVFSHSASGTYAVHTPKDKRCEDVIKWPGFDGQESAEDNAEFIAVANPANVKTLVEALEKAQQKVVEIQQGCENDPRIHEIIDLKEHVIETNDVLCNLLPDCRYMDPPDGGSVTPLEQVSRMVADYRQRIAELESRTVTVKLPEEAVDQVCLAAAEIHNRGNGVSDDKAQFIINRIRNYLENGGELKGAGIQVIEGEG